MRAILSGQRFSLRKVLRWMVLVCVLPAALVCTALVVSLYQSQLHFIQQSTVLSAESTIADLERELATIEAGLNVLATSEELVSGNLRDFHQRARNALAPGIVYAYILTDPEGRQLLNTARPFGAELPSTGTPPQLRRVFSERATVLTDLFMGPVVKKQVIAMGVPVGSGDRVSYSLNIGLDTARIDELIDKQTLPEGWVMAVLDSSGTIVGRSRDAERFRGQKATPEVIEAIAAAPSGVLESTTKEGVPVYSAFVTSKRWGWTVAVGAPTTVLLHNALEQWLWVALAVVLAVLLGLAMARLISKRVLASVHLLNQAAADLSQGKDIQLPKMMMMEADAVSQAMLDAAQAMKKIRFFAEHDALTELPNRHLFETVTARDLARAQRKPLQSALLAVDLDRFKQVNDTLGHETGDVVLRTAAKRILQAIRGSDIAARIGGDEFLVFLNDTSVDGAMDTAQRIVDLLSAPYASVPIAVSASVGVAIFPLHGSTLRELSGAADEALYRAKHAGRKQAVLAGPPVPHVNDADPLA